MIIGLIIGFSLNYFKSSIRFDYKTILYGVLIASIVLLILTKLYQYFFKRLPSDKGIYLGRHSFTIKEEGLIEESDTQSTTIKWTGILNIEETSSMIFVFVDNIAANFIPKHFFSDDAEANKFVSALFNKYVHIQRGRVGTSINI